MCASLTWGVPALLRVLQLQACQITPLTTSHPFWCTAGEDAKIRLWRIPEGGLQETLQEPEAILRGEGTHRAPHTGDKPARWHPQLGTTTHYRPSPGHTEKIYSIRFHPVASDLLVSSSYDMTVRIWELSTRQEVMCLQGHTDQVRDDKTWDT